MESTKKAPRSNETRIVVNGVEYVVRSFNIEGARETAEQILTRLIKACVATELRNTEGSV